MKILEAIGIVLFSLAIIFGGVAMDRYLEETGLIEWVR